MASDDSPVRPVPNNPVCWLLPGRYSVQVRKPRVVSGAGISVTRQAAKGRLQAGS